MRTSTYEFLGGHNSAHNLHVFGNPARATHQDLWLLSEMSSRERVCLGPEVQTQKISSYELILLSISHFLLKVEFWWAEGAVCRFLLWVWLVRRAVRRAAFPLARSLSDACGALIGATSCLLHWAASCQGLGI